MWITLLFAIIVFSRALANFDGAHGCPFHLYELEMQYNRPEAPIMCAQPPLECWDSRYRSIDGSCNNLYFPEWGMSFTRYQRLLPPNYGDGLSTPSLSISGAELPNARLVSLVVFDDISKADNNLTFLNMEFGQFKAHDMSFTAGPTMADRHSKRCCLTQNRDKSFQGIHGSCNAILAPNYRAPNHPDFEINCINMVRTFTDRNAQCPDVHPSIPAEQMNVITSYLDLSVVYGNIPDQCNSLRAHQFGRMTVLRRNGYDWPPQVAQASSVCDVQSQNEVCYLTGDARNNQTPALSTLHILFLREHNRLADALHALNPHWDDELLFQEARKINIGQYQRIAYYGWLTIFLGRDHLLETGILYNVTGGEYINDYDPTVNPGIINGFTTAAYRYFHTQIPNTFGLVDEHRNIVQVKELKDAFFRPYVIEENNSYDFLVRGIATTPQSLTDANFEAATRYFLGRGNQTYGDDLRAMDIHRNRDHALATYNSFRKYCGLRKAKKWDDYLDYIPAASLKKLKSVYSYYEDVELTVGGSLETHVDPALVGPTFLCILTEQFRNNRIGDRFFFEHGPSEHAFSNAQLAEIRKTTMARIICDNGNNIESMQESAFVLPSASNPVVPCTEIPFADLTAWKV